MNVFWFRRDLRLNDNAGLYYALREGVPVLPVFIFDTNILDDLEDRNDARVSFIYDSICAMNDELSKHGSSLHVYHNKPIDAFKKIINDFRIDKVFTNNDYENYAVERDVKVMELLGAHGITFHSFKDQVIFEKDEVIKDDGSPYTIYTPYSRKWKAKLNKFYLKSYPTEKYFKNLYQGMSAKMLSLELLGFRRSDIEIPPKELHASLFRNYNKERDYPGEDGTSRLGIHLRFGTLSIRELVRYTKELSEKYLNELIWREFYQMLTWHLPHIGKGEACRKEFDRIKWRYDEKQFEQWCQGKTGYPLVDAGMRQLNATGYMHNRVRMVTASFLSKHLLIDWRWGEAYFARLLLDYDFAANNGGWQWAAGTGCDAAPYFRIFNPTAQAKKFDPQLKYIKRWVPEVDSFDYPDPIVDHEFARKRCLEAYSEAVKK